MNEADQHEVLNQNFGSMSSEEVIEWALLRWYPRIALGSSFGAEDVVLIDMLAKIRPDVRVVTLDTGRLPQATYDVMDRIREQYDITIEAYAPAADEVEAMINEHGFNLFYESIANRKLCCGIRKVQPLKRALKDVDAWITGLRREQSMTRKEVKTIEVDDAHSIFKVSPLIEWTTDQVWEHIKRHNVPYNELHDRNYPSIGCEPCTRAIQPGEDERAGRWWWEQSEQKECGLHTNGEDVS